MPKWIYPWVISDCIPLFVTSIMDGLTSVSIICIKVQSNKTDEVSYTNEPISPDSFLKPRPIAVMMLKKTPHLPT